jgi:Transglutaminase-like superfamily
VAENRARAGLDRLAAHADGIAKLEPMQRAQALVDLLAKRERFACDRERDPSSLLLDRVVEGRRGHPLALAVVYAAVARRAGVELNPIESVCMLGNPSADPPLAIDPAPRSRPPPRPARWLCPHIVALMLINAIGTRYLMRGDLARAIRAAELRLRLPLAGDARDRHAKDLASLRALLN